MSIASRFGIGLIICGVIYLAKPDIFRRGIWTRTSIAQRMLSPAGYIKYMRGFGAALIAIGLILQFVK